MRVLVTGAFGMLGHALVPAIVRLHWPVIPTDQFGAVHRFPYPSVETDELDVTDTRLVQARIKDWRPELVIHLAAMTDLEQCEDDPVEAEETNVEGTRYVAAAAFGIGAKFVYVSTAGVFDGTKALYNEDSTPNPINVYGRTKLRGEQIALAIDPRSLVVRAGWMFGGGPAHDHKFVGMILKQLNSGVRNLTVVVDKEGSPTWTKDLSNAILKLVESGAYGVWHAAGRGCATRYDVAREIIASLGNPDISINRVNSEHFSDDYYAPRPHREVLDSRSPGIMRPWQLALREYVQTEWMQTDAAGAKQPAAIA